MINKVTLIGNLGKDPEVRHLENGASVARFSVATNENYKDKEGNWQTQTEWHSVVLWRVLAERAEKELKKGSLVYVEGRLRTRQYQDNNGIERSITEVEGQSYKSLDRRDKSDPSFPSVADEPPQLKEKVQTPSPSTPSIADMPEDDLPF